MTKYLKFEKGEIDLLPGSPGVYIYFNGGKKVLYVGKAKNLKNRVSTYLLKDLEPKTRQMVSQTALISYIRTDSELEAYLLEASLISKFKPKYNIELKDDKSPLYIGITDEEFPRPLALRRTQLAKFKLKRVFGPFSQAYRLRGLLAYLRRIFPYCTHKPSKKPCLYSQIGLCDPCPTLGREDKTLKKRYMANISGLKAILSGRISSIKATILKNIKLLSQKEKFEEAAILRDRLELLEYLTKPSFSFESYLKDPNLIEDIRAKELSQLAQILSPYFPKLRLRRIECYDVAHLAGTNPTASMVTFIKGEPEKAYYRRFKVRRAKGGSDTDSMREVLERRLNHIADWGKPDLIIVDGGKPQISAAKEILEDKIAVVGIAKRYETLVIKDKNKFSQIRFAPSPALRLVQRLRDESHRFARKYHHHLIAKALTR